MSVTKISAQAVSELRARTGAGMMDCKRALEATGGDMEKAVELLRQKGQAKADRRAGRQASEGVVAAHLAPDGRAGGLVELNTETDFVAMNDEVRALARDLARHVADTSPTATPLAEQPVAGKANATVGQLVKGLAAKTGENVVVGRSARLELSAGEGGLVESYVHFNGQVGVLVALGVPNAAAVAHAAVRELAKELTLHIASAKPIAVSTADVPADVVERERRIYEAQVVAEKKPDAVKAKIVDGKLRKFFEERVLLEQAFVKDDTVKVRDLVRQAGARAGGEIVVRRFARFAVGGE